MSLQLSLFEKAGVEVTQQGTVAEVFRASELDWQVEQKLVYADKGTPNDPFFKHIPSVVANYRSDNNQFLGMVHPKTYKVVQNVEAFDFIDGLPGFTFEKVGSFNGGKKVFVVGKADDQVFLDGSDDPVNFYMTFLHGHDGKSGIRFLLSPIRMFCMNQLNLMLEAATFKYNIAHTGNVNEKISMVKRAIENSKGYVQNLQIEMDRLINLKPDITIENFLEKLIPMEDNDSDLITTRKEEAMNNILHLYNNKDDLQNYTGTGFGYISAVSDYISHLKPGRSDADINNILIRNLEGNDLLNDAYAILRAA